MPSLHDNKKYRAEEHLQPLLFGFLGSNMSEALEFAAETRQVAAVWMDGLRGLMNKEMVETETLEIVKELSE